MFVEDPWMTRSWRLSSNHTILMVELFAINECIQWIRKIYKKILCFTDSLSAIHLILNYRVSSYRKIISEIQRRLMKIQDKGIILYIQILTSHDGILGNEVADQASKKACKLNVITACEMKFEEHLINLKSEFWKFNFTQWKEALSCI